MFNYATAAFKRAFITGFILLGLYSVQSVRAQSPVQLTIKADKPTARISPNMWGIFFEDINFSADGGLYAELIKNRSFEFPMPMMGWKQTKTAGKDASVLIVNHNKSDSANARYASISLNNGDGYFILTNEGFRGIGLHKGEQYNFSIKMRLLSGDVRIRIQAVAPGGQVIGTGVVGDITGDWNIYKCSFISSQTEANAKLNVVFEGKGKIDADLISLFPKKTWKGRENGLRADLAQKLADLHPGFMRFPGGCIVEGRELLNRYQWKKTVGPVANRELIMNRWNVEFPKKAAPDYYQSFGLGFFEYFQFCEDIGASPLPILNCGMACQYNSAEVATLSQIDPYIQDALDLIEFANGSTGTRWGALRAAMGHPAPFNLKMLGVGNEQWGPQYVERYKLFAAALKKRYPTIKLVSSVGPKPDGEEFDLLSKKMRAEKADFVDEHYYQHPDWFLKNASRYDTYERNATKVFAGEYAAHITDAEQSSPRVEGHNTWWAALAEAAFMTGLERNADVVQIASYAPLLAHVNAWQWRPDLIWFDNLESVATPNYYVQQLFATYKGSAVVPSQINGKAVAGQDSLYASTVIDSVNNRLIIKLMNTSATPKSIKLDLQSKIAPSKAGEWVYIQNANKAAFNSLEQPEVVKPGKRIFNWPAKSKTVTVDGLSANVLIVPFQIRK